MIALASRNLVALWFVDDRPVRMVWRGVRYRVTDVPTRLTEDVFHPALTHPAERFVGWRFQGTSSDGVTRVFDVRKVGDDWELLHDFE